MSAPVEYQLRHLFRAGGIFLLCWLVFEGLEHLAYSMYVPHIVSYLSLCTHPFRHSNLGMPTIDVLRALYPALVGGAFTGLAYRLPVRAAIITAFVGIQVLALALLAAFHLFRLF